MKKQMKLFTLLMKPIVLFVLLFALGVGEMWGTWYVPGTISYDGSERWAVTDNSMGGDNKQITFWALPAGTYKFQLTNGSSWGGNSCITETEGSDLSTGTEGDNATFTITKPKNITIKVTNESTWKVKVSAATPCAYIRYNWNEAGWNWSAAMSHNGDGTCSCIGQYGNTKAFDWQFSSAEQHYNDGTSGVTLVGNPQKGDKCVFTYNQSDQSLEIRKCNTTEATSYIYFDNTETGWTNTYKYFVIGRPVDATNPYSVTYALTEITNTKLWYHESTATWGDAGYYAAIGSDATFGTGNWNCDNLATASKYTAAYTSQYNLANTNHNIITPASSENGSAITMESKGTTYSSLNSLTVGYKYVLDGSDMTSGGAPAQIIMNSYVFNAHSTVTGNAAQTINANASGTYSKSNMAAYRGKVVLTQSNLSDGYKFIGWYNGNTQKETNNEYTYYPNENTTISAKYEYRWTLKGTFPDETEWAEDHYISNFSINASSEDVGYLDIDLPGNTSFQFKVVDRTNNAWHSCSGTSESSEYNFTYLSDKEKDCSACTGSEKNMIFNTAAPGTYRFTWNADTKTLTVTYPASYKVTYDGNDKTSGTVPTDNDYYAANATVTVKGNGGSLTKTGYNTLAYWNTENDGSGTDIAISTGTFSITDNTTLYAKWTQGVTLHDNNGAAHNGSTTVNWNAAGPFSITAPTRDHYSVEGYYAEVGCTNKVLTAAGAIAASSVVDGSSVTYISSSKWKHAAATTLYAKWTEDPYTVTTSAGTGGSVDAASYTAYIATTTAISATPETGYKFHSWEVISGDVTFADQYSASTTITATENSSIKANFVYRWSIAGSWLYYPETVNWDADTYAMGNITKVSSDDVCSVEITLPANTNYTFQVVDRSSSPYTWWGNSNEDSAPFYMTYGNSTDWRFDDGYSKACGITTAGAGTYTFTWNITDRQLTVTYPTSYYVTAATAGGGTVTPSSATYMSTSVGGEITATPNYAYYFNGWTSNAGGTFTNASAATTTFKPASAAATVTAAFAERTAFIEANFQVYNSDRSVRTKTGNSWADNSTAIKMNYDSGNNRYYLHTYSTPAELKEQLNNADAYFYIKTSSSTSSIANDVSYHASGADALQSLSAYGSSNKKATSTVYTANSFKFTGSEDGYVIIYFNGTHVWYELECALSYYGGEGATGDAPAERTYYAYNSNQTAASNSYSKTGYTFDHWDTAADDSGSDYAAGATNVAMNAHEVCLHAMWTINNHDITYTAPSNGSYTIKAGDASAVSENVDDVDYSTTVTLAATPASGYSFSSWSLTGATAADASSANTTFSMPDNDVTVAASFTEDKHTVTVEVGSAGGGVFSYGGSSSLTTKEISGIGISTATGDIVVDSLNPAWRFKKWEYDGAKITITTGGYTSKTIRVNATADATITAVFEPRFGLIGSLNEDGDPAGGMPNKDGETWGIVRSEDYEADFEVISFTAVGNGEGTGVDLRCTRTLESNKQYKFQIVDRATVGRDRFCLAADGSALLEANESITLNYKEQSNANVLINTIGYGEYTFRITNIAATTYNPTVTVDRPTDSKQLTLKCGYSIDAASSVTLSNDGGTAMGHTDEGGDGFDISDGGFFKSGSHITFTATPATGYVFEGWYTDNTYGTRFATDNPMTMTEGTNANVTVYARFIEKTNTFTDGASTGYWNNTSNWSLGSLPTINERVVITKPVTVDIAYATAKRIILNQNDNTGKLTVQANKGLEVAETITRTTDGSNSLATREEDLILESSSSEGNASLIFNNSNSNAATVQMYSKADIDGDTWNWQYVGTPFTGSIPQYNYYGSWMYKWNGGKWDVVTGSETLDPFAGYCLTQESATTHVMGGTLVSTTDDVEVTMAAKTDMVLANSWTAPIWIGGFTEETFKSKPATIYLFNTGSAESGSTAGKEAGTYEAVPVNSGPYFGTELIPSMQGFFVTTNGVGGSAGSITLKYDELVRSNEYRRTGSVAPITSGPMYAPKRETKPEVMKIKTLGAKYSDRVVILERADFSQGFDNGWDGEKLSFGAEAPSVYVINQEGGYDAVSAIPGFEGTLVGFRAGANNSCTMSFEYDGDETLYLNDLQAQMSTLISEENNYTFTTSAGDSEVRFIISATPIQKVPTGIGNDANDANDAMVKVRKLIINDHVYIIRSGRMYGVDGQMIK